MLKKRFLISEKLYLNSLVFVFVFLCSCERRTPEYDTYDTGYTESIEDDENPDLVDRDLEYKKEIVKDLEVSIGKIENDLDYIKYEIENNSIKSI